MSYRRDLREMRFGRLIAIEPTPLRKDSKVVWKCQCDCGKECFVVARALTIGNTKSCGCLKRELLQAGLTKLEYGIANFNQLFGNYKRQAMKRGLSFNLTREEFYELTQKDCYYCGISPYQVQKRTDILWGDFIYNGVDRLNNTLGYEIDNVVPCCGKCNRAKMSLNEDEFLDLIKSIYINKFLI